MLQPFIKSYRSCFRFRVRKKMKLFLRTQQEADDNSLGKKDYKKLYNKDITKATK